MQFANGMVDVYRGKFDVLSISGVLSVNFQADLKISLADDTGKTFGKVLNIKCFEIKLISKLFQIEIISNFEIKSGFLCKYRFDGLFQIRTT